MTGPTEQSGESIGELYDRLPEGEWVSLPEYGVRVKRWRETAEAAGPTGSGDRDLALQEQVSGLLDGLKPESGEETVERVRGRWAACDRHRNSLIGQLARTQAALAASQSDLTAMTELRDESDVLYLDTIDKLDNVRRDWSRLKDNERRWAGEVEYAERERDEARAELTSAVKELTLLRAKLEERETYIAELRESWT